MPYYVTCRLHGPLSTSFPNKEEAKDARTAHLNAYPFPHGAEVLILRGEGEDGIVPFQKITILENLEDHIIEEE